MSEETRRNPDELLVALKSHEASAHRGRLKIFFGASAGVGKTYSMLEAARAANAAGTDLVIGYVEPHGRVETERLVDGLEALPPLEVEYRNIIRREFDLDAALARRPAVLVVDELAHSNVVGGTPHQRHAKRWQDIEEILEAGICVWTTLNVQHLESLNDVVAGITGVQQRETIPDRVFDQAADVELIDLPPGDLLERLRAGKVYSAAHVSAATQRYFREPNLLALRELALRRTADRVDAAARVYRDSEQFSQPWLARDRFLVAVDLQDQAEQLIRVGKRFADALDAEWVVVSVETPAMLRLGESARNRRIEILRLAESLGAEAVTLGGPSASSTLAEYARVRNITRIVVGEPRRSGLLSLLRPSTSAKLVRANGGFDVSVIARRKGLGRESPAEDPPRPQDVNWKRYAWAAAISTGSTALAASIYPYVSLSNLVMIYLLGATIAALRLGRGPASFAAVVNTFAFDFFFVPPRFSFAVADAQYVITFAVMLTVALIIASLVANVRAQTRVAGARERRTALLYAMSRELAATRSLEDLAKVAVKHVAETFASRAVVLVPGEGTRLRHPVSAPFPGSLQGADLSIAQWVYDRGVPAGLGTDTLPAAGAQYLPLKGPSGARGVLAVEPMQRRRLLLPEQRHLLETFAAQIALALERASLQDAAERSSVSAESDRLRNTLLASISHDLRTPLSVITGASSALNDRTMKFDEDARRVLTTQIEAKSREMATIVSNVLDLMRFETGDLTLRLEPVAVDDLVSTALARVDERLAHHEIEVEIPADLPLVDVDSALIVQVFTNLLENVAKHTPAQTRVRLAAVPEDRCVQITVEDNGPGLPGGDAERLFAKFQRGRVESQTTGAGLGLAICRAIVNAHGGQIEAGDREGGGARFTLRLPRA